MLEVDKLKSGYGGIQVIWDVSFTINEGEIVALVGGNGAGKTTTLKTISGLLKNMGGSVLFEGRHIENQAPHQVITHGIALVPEGRRVLPYMTVRENLEMGAYTVRDKRKIEDNLEWVFTLFPKLKERQSQLAGTFSGGEQQMLVIARALMSRPRFLMLDEPSMGLQPSIVQSVFESLGVLHSEGVTILLVEQNVRKSLQLAQRAYVIEHGRIVMSGPSGELLENDEVKKAYLGI